MPVVIVKQDFRIWMSLSFIKHEHLNFVYYNFVYLINKYLAINSSSSDRGKVVLI